MADRLDRFLIGAGAHLHHWLEVLQGAVFAVIDDASRRIMRRRWMRQLKDRRRG